MIRLFYSAVCAAMAAGILAGCSGSSLGSSDSSLLNPGTVSRLASGPRMAPINVAQALGVAPEAGAARLHLGTDVRPATHGGLYGSVFDGECYSEYCYDEGTVNGYPNPNRNNDGPTCSIPAYFVNGIGTDPAGNLMVPGYFGSGLAYSINVYKGPSLCGALVGSISDDTGNAADAASPSATTGKIYVTEINYTSGVGDVVVCTISAGCGSPVTNSHIGWYAAGVTFDTKGDCWLSAYTAKPPSGTAILVYWKGCTGSGQVATGYKNKSYGGLFTDKNGNIGAVDDTSSVLYIYKGCNPACSVAGGPYKLKGESFFGNLDSAGNVLALGDVSQREVDVYTYRTTGLTYLYSFSNGLRGYGTYYVESGAFELRNKL